MGGEQPGRWSRSSPVHSTMTHSEKNEDDAGSAREEKTTKRLKTRLRQVPAYVDGARSPYRESGRSAHARALPGAAANGA